MRELRDYQSEIIHSTREALRFHKRVMIKAPTGAGKTVIAAEIIRMAREKRNLVSFIVPAISLINQTVESFREHGIADIGVMQADHELTDFNATVQVCSKDTLSRRNYYPESSLVIIDEAHVNSKFIYDWQDDHPETVFIGLSATPWTKGLGEHWECLVNIVGTRELITKELLCDFEVYSPSAPDLAQVKVVRGDYDIKALGLAVNRDPLIADIVSTWQRLGEDRNTVCYAVDRAHAAHIQQEFQEAGIGAGYIDAFTPVEEREAIYQQLLSKEIRIVCNVGCLTTGIDWDIRCLILARPTKSEILFVQIVGRGLRTNAEGDNCIILDHSDTTSRLGFVTDIDCDTLDMGQGAREPIKERVIKEPTECPKCKYLKLPGTRKCPNCGFEPEVQPNIETIDGTLVKAGQEHVEKVWLPVDVRNTYAMFLCYANTQGYKPGWAYHKTRAMCGRAPKATRSIEPMEPSPEIKRFITHQAIKYARRRKTA